ncbi:hypothetical protein PC120_g27408 [Phytophthora cactorum]|nr:hypothetical protein PC120_g27408 [Phytophthora cactorum]
MKLLQAAPEDRNEGKAPFEGLIDGPYGNLSIDIEDSATYSHFVFFAEDMGVTSVYRELATQSVLFSQSTHFTSPTLCLVCQ